MLSRRALSSIDFWCSGDIVFGGPWAVCGWLIRYTKTAKKTNTKHAEKEKQANPGRHSKSHPGGYPLSLRVLVNVGWAILDRVYYGFVISWLVQC